jgi:secondary thiamine-phosphate synthase enzyme
MVDITARVRTAVRESKVESGLCVLYVPHTTAAVAINEHADPDVTRDIIRALDGLVPVEAGYAHGEGNSNAHIKSAIMGNSRVVLVDRGEPVLGTWEGVFFCEFDGPRSRSVFIKIIGG